MAVDRAGKTLNRRYKKKYTPDVLRAIPVWLSMGLEPKEIARVLGSTISALQVVCSKNNISLRRAENGTLRGLSPHQKARLVEEALKRNKSVAEFVDILIKIIIDEDLFRSIIDD